MSKSMWDKEYDTEQYMYGKQPNDFLEANYEQLPKGNILMLAEGEGRNAIFLAKLGYQVTAVDISEVGLSKACKLASENNVQIKTICTDLEHFDLGVQQWDGIVSIFCHLPAALRQSLYQRVELALKPKGVMLIEGYTPEQLNYESGGPPVAEMMISKSILVKELPHLQFSILQELQREVIEGVKHSGLAAVVQAVAYAK
ncbi:SAM-dependent methyltransferase [Psychromonas marina]|uniref:SAM-dependent methyltransferase n=1 Tax=Psychromonas marina TaxID=88364 RepID=A0ABQ6E0S0_9GAMM|nr:class I SAM-dependent methyltransferase [Psychromonas marina]GLS91024.1 SAM-dependent methyltransferase [Psychromonas marina]